MARTPWVDQEACISCGLCASICPGVFRFAENGKSEVYDPAGASEQEIQQAIDGCPVQCISWKE
ncbi:ferredoxin [Geobacter sp.]|uniref:ferredoxin n=1 Tax=Geobacter sp. TaxID=46610 RepID=UPI001AC5B563|nr:ferredoxin [Geobacter sp.]CAG0948364.1 2-oxoglutarate ferredoxin oxidoreductase subunit delta [Geobacteraceae bacterium]